VEQAGQQENLAVDEGLKRGDIRAAGGVLWRRAPGGNGNEDIEVALVHRPRYDDWSLPKGKLDPGETEFEAALREVEEETGHIGRPGRSLGKIRYLKSSGGVTRPKIISYWAMQANGGSFKPGREVDELKWVPVDSARSLLTYPTDREVLGRFASQPLTTGLVLLVRHANAGQRAKWKGDDRVRPVDAKGAQQSRDLVRFLGKFDVRRIVSADFVRCVQTVEPLSRALGVPIEQEPMLSELGYPRHEQETVDLFRKLEEQGGAVVACSQGDVIPDLLHRLAAQDRVPLHGDFVARKGSVWALCFSGRKLYALEYFPPPDADD
jgi:8-oxo-dGTP pyrophosphatase MutT (NUDIX family)/phosphohistidine phosphatase SixA